MRAVLFALALLFAQQVALVHAVSHLDHEAQSEEQKELCDQHAAMGAVLGALDTAAPAPCLASSVFHGFLAPERGERVLAAPTPSSRDPPGVSLT